MSFASDTATKLGIDKRTIERAVRRAERIAPEVKERIAQTSIADKGVELDALATMKPAQQMQAIKLVEKGKAETVRDARQKIAPRPVRIAAQIGRGRRTTLR